MAALEPSELRKIHVARWNYLYRTQLPSLATSKSPAQTSWPVHLDHCFARIILDNSVGRDGPWNSKIKSPAYKYLSIEQLRSCIKLGEDIVEGRTDLASLNEKSLKIRGKRGMKRKAEVQGTKSINLMPLSEKRRNLDGRHCRDIREMMGSDERFKRPDGDAPTTTMSNDARPSYTKIAAENSPPLSRLYIEDAKNLIADSNLTSFRQRVLLALLQVPRGRYTTYAALSNFLGSSARAVGNAMRNNPFAPTVPCHRVLAADGSIGGFRGDWGVEGKYAQEKLALLREEGVKFDGKGKAVGSTWRGFK